MKDEDIFEHLKFKDGKTYQVRIEKIEKLTGLKFDWLKVLRSFKDKVPKVLSEIVRKVKAQDAKKRRQDTKNRT